jgi:hypothetical protein
MVRQRGTVISLAAAATERIVEMAPREQKALARKMRDLEEQRSSSGDLDAEFYCGLSLAPLQAPCSQAVLDYCGQAL